MVQRLLAARASLAQPETPTLLVTPTGLRFKLSRFSQYWGQILSSWRAPASFCPQRLRHIFVEERSGPDAAPVRPASPPAQQTALAAPLTSLVCLSAGPL